MSAVIEEDIANIDTNESILDSCIDVSAPPTPHPIRSQAKISEKLKVKNYKKRKLINKFPLKFLCFKNLNRTQ